MEKSKYKKILRNFKMGDPKGLEALKKKILEEQEDGEYENQNLIDNDMGEFQNPKNAQMLPYDEEKWEVSFDSLRMLEPIGSGIILKSIFYKKILGKCVSPEKLAKTAPVILCY